MNYSKILLVGFLSINVTSCALVSGLQTYNLPAQGEYKTDLGSTVNVVPLNQSTIANMPAIKSENVTNYAALFNTQQQIYKLASGDVLSIQLWNYPEISPPIVSTTNEQSVQAYGYPIDQEGYIQLPLVGRYLAQGKTLPQINKEVRQLFARYLKSPDVVVRVIAYQGKRYSVQGNVQKGGQFYLTDQPVNVYAALGLAGGVTTTGDTTSVVLVRQGQSYNLNTVALEKLGYSLNKLLIQPNDTIYVNSKTDNKIYLMGEAGKNQALAMRDQGMTLSDVLGEGLGVDATSASARKIYVVRSDVKDKQTTIYQMNLSNIGDFGLANQFVMQRNDVVYVDATGLTRWQRIVNQIIPFSSTLYTIDQLGK
ncbi:polysaccharide biosynthesis/export family protein [Acinetobacter sp. B10A]|uniref:polysaccharide biosynthesis/export family protein n=1 Tax=Acinetobacter baretiae TaxID=2605383 RepID=UPI001B3C8257|nr:polysaccharide biosynthesis/export family protein [Acinetobacter baretiae]MBF7685637.1 polysaccharide biosynthesis/export family protein [Acinetobacter baretiae]